VLPRDWHNCRADGRNPSALGDYTGAMSRTHAKSGAREEWQTVMIATRSGDSAIEQPTTSDIVLPTLPKRFMRFSMASDARAARRRRCGSGNRNLGAFARRTRGSRRSRRTGGRHAARSRTPPERCLGGGTSRSHGAVFAGRRPRLCAQSFHWFRTTDALSEFARILKERRRPAISWNRRSTGDPLTVGYRQAIVDVGGEIE